MRDAVVKGSTTFSSSSKLTKLPSVYPSISGLKMNSPKITYLVTPKKGIPLSIFVFTPQLQYLLLYMNKIVRNLV